jgi:3-methyladenine DNA glycosylase AlkD
MIPAAPFIISKAANWLREQLADGAQHAAGELLAEARKYGIAERTLQEARKSIGATSDRLYALNPAGVKKLAAHVWQLQAE